MEVQVSPTKGNLISVKKSLELAKMGFELLDRKRNILIRETVAFVSKAEEIQGRIAEAYTDAYQALQLANMEHGLISVSNIAKACPIDSELQFEYRSIMGVDVPSVKYEPKPLNNSYGYFDTTDDLDIAAEKFNTVKHLTVELAEIENSVFRLANGISKTQKRANALKNIIIPRMTEQVRFISAALEEKEREEFSRLKVIKNNIK